MDEESIEPEELEEDARDASRRGDHARARLLLERATALLRDENEQETPRYAYIATCLGYVQQRLNDLEAAVVTHADAVRLRRAGNRPSDLAQSLHYLGDTHLQLREVSKADACLQESLRLYREIPGSNGTVAHLLYDLACMARDHSRDLAAARAAFEEALLLFRRQGDLFGEARVLNQMVGLLLETDCIGEAEETAYTGMVVAEEIAEAEWQSVFLYQTARVAMAQQNYKQAQHRISEYLLLRRQLADNPTETIRALMLLASAHYYQNRFLKALETYREALALCHRESVTGKICYEAWEFVGGTLLRLRRRPIAAWMYGVAQTLRDAAAEQDSYSWRDTCLARLRRTLSREAFEEQREQGRAASLSDALQALETELVSLRRWAEVEAAIKANRVEELADPKANREA